MPFVATPTLVAVVSCHSRPAYRAAQRRTWAQHLKADVRFFVGDSGRVSQGLPDEVDLLVDDSYDGLSQKTHAIARWALDRGYEAVFKVNDDVMIFPSRFQMPVPEADYAGWVWDEGTWIQGHAYWMRRRALEILCDQPVPPVASTQVEDRWVGKVLVGAGVKAWSDPGIGCVRRPQSSTPFHLGEMMTATDPYYAAAEFRPEELEAIYFAAYSGQSHWRRAS